MGYESIIHVIEKIEEAERERLRELMENVDMQNIDYTLDQIDSLEDNLLNSLEDELQRVISAIEESDDVPQALSTIAAAVIPDENFQNAVREIFVSQFTDALEVLTDSYIKFYDKDLAFMQIPVRSIGFINDWSSELSDIMNLSNSNRINSIFETALAEGQGIPDVIEQLQESYNFSRTRARRTAITEMLRSHSYSADDAIMQSPSVDRVEWIHSGPRLIQPRPEHVALNGTTIQKGQLFTINAPNGTFQAPFPRHRSLPASQVIECHCLHRGIVNDDILGLSIEERRGLQAEALAEFDSTPGLQPPTGPE